MVGYTALGEVIGADTFRTVTAANQGRVTDHRINLTLYKLDEVVSGDLDAVIVPLQQEHQAELLASLADDQ